jgi:hypothetical protein
MIWLYCHLFHLTSIKEPPENADDEQKQKEEEE